MESQVTAEDEGKPVVYGDDTIGRVVEVTDGTAYVDPDPGITDTIASKLGWGSADDDAFPLQPELVRAVDDDVVRLETEL